MYFIGCGVAQCIKPASATVCVYPPFAMHPLRVGAKENVVTPLLIRQGRRVLRTRDMRFTMAAELSLISLATPGTLNDKHGLTCIEFAQAAQ
jgi:hypothetical protein